jgi:hypothetical protein
MPRLHAAVTLPLPHCRCHTAAVTLPPVLLTRAARHCPFSLRRARLKEKVFRSMEFLFQKGQASTCVYFIMSGTVELLEPGAESTSVTTDEHSFSVDIDESLTLDANAGPLVAQGIINGRLHMDRQKVGGHMLLVVLVVRGVRGAGRVI